MKLASSLCIGAVFLALGLLKPPLTQANDFHELVKSARSGTLEAQLHLGSSYYHGQGAPRDYEKSALWYRRAAEQGAVSAQYHLGMMFAEGKGVPQSFVEGYGWIVLASEQGESKAAQVLGDLRNKMKKDDLILAEEKAVRLKGRLIF